MVILIQTISTKLTVKSVQNATIELPSEYSPVMKDFRQIHLQNVITEVFAKGALLHRWVNLLLSGLYST